MIEVDKNDPNKMVARTCGMWSDQWFEEEWTDGSIAWGDHFFRSTDGGETWQNITPGQGETIYDEKYFLDRHWLWSRGSYHLANLWKVL